eukprot:5979634-Amphidinium_carterae.1
MALSRSPSQQSSLVAASTELTIEVEAIGILDIFTLPSSIQVQQLVAAAFSSSQRKPPCTVRLLSHTLEAHSLRQGPFVRAGDIADVSAPCSCLPQRAKDP